ncbi:hypothetical protein GOP47_0017671 [Adiantum capillus-veneris]|uniref:TFIIS N-terminal domain-containing protein n=1 Tax=Adiantum capillus-veneris TaxID=13818 RepID=A0A9D4UGN9_ADICA|nr:hypothetical protein GOP47_0017671 [Adiantum capillus-veneris]
MWTRISCRESRHESSEQCASSAEESGTELGSPLRASLHHRFASPTKRAVAQRSNRRRGVLSKFIIFDKLWSEPEGDGTPFVGLEPHHFSLITRECTHALVYDDYWQCGARHTLRSSRYSEDIRMQQISVGSGLHGSQAQGSASSQSTRSVGDPPQSSLAISSRSKKRERSDLVCDPVKLQKTEKGRKCGEEGNSTLKPEASSLVGKDGGISSVASVDRLVCIMQYEWNDSAERQLELVVSRTMLAKVVATTSDRDCLVKFLKLGGLSILDKWLQEAHRGKHFANKEISEDGLRAVEDLLLTLLGALERLPVDLVALKTCPVGKSVNLLRNHKHFDIQRRSKKLVDSWKKRVESEMKQSMDVRFPIDLVQHQEGALIASKAQQVCYSEQPTSHVISGEGRGKFASVASLCSPQEVQLKTPSTVMAFNSAVDISGDVVRKAALSSHVPSRPYKGELLDSPRLPSSPSDDGRTKASMEGTVARLPSDQVKGSKSTGASRIRRSPNATSSKTSSITATLPGPAKLCKDSPASYSRELHEFAPQSGTTLPCCSSSQKYPLTSDHDGHSRSSLNSFSSCATECNNRFSVQACMCSEPGKAAIQMLANIAASEGSMVEKGSDSPSNRSISMQRGLTIPVDSSLPLVTSMKYYNQPISKAGSRVQDGEHYDQISSNVSSPSESSAHVDVRACESKRTLAVSAMTFYPHDITFETNFPRTHVRKDGARECDTQTCVPVEPRTMQAMRENLKAVSLQPALQQEAVGESNGCERMKSKGIASVQSGSSLESLERSSVMGGLHRTSTPSHNNNECLEGSRQAVLVVPSEFEGIAPAKEVTGRPVFDLNEIVSSEDPANLAMAASSTGLTVPTYTMPASGSKPAFPVTPMTPIAVVAAAKGSFTLPSASYLPRGEMGWKGSAPTSAFRPTQPRNHTRKPNLTPTGQGASLKVVMDFDLNVAVDSGFVDHDMGLNSTSAAASLTSNQGTTCNFGRSGLSQKTYGSPGAAWDLNQVDEGVGESQARPDFDLNCGPVSQDSDDVVLSSKHHGNRVPFVSDVSNSGATNRVPSHPLHSATPIMMPAFAMTDSEFSYPLGAGAPWSNSGPHEGSYGGIPFGFSPASMQSFSAPFMDTLCRPHTASLAPPSMSNGQTWI